MVDQRTSLALKAALTSAQAGDIGGARRVAEQALSAGGDRVALNAFLGMLMARSGDAATAVRHLRIAHAARPGDTTIACNLIGAMIEAGDHAAALAVATAERALADPSLRLARYRGFLAQLLERFEDAAAAYAHVVARAPGDFESWNNLGNARSALGQYDAAVTALEQAVRLHAQAPPMRLNLADALDAAGRGDAALDVLRRATADFPDDARAWHRLYVQLKKRGIEPEALAALETASERDPANAEYHLALGVEHGLVSRTHEAEAAFRAAIACDPRCAAAYLGLAIQYEHGNREGEFAPLVATGVAGGVDAGTLDFIRALDCRRAGRLDEGLAVLARVPATVEPHRAAYLKGTLLDRLERADEAFPAFEHANGLHAADPSDPLRRAAAYRQEIRDEIATLTPDWAAQFTADAGPRRPDPVFLIGFPRSGTTLLDTFLMGHPGTTVMEERPPLNHVDRELGGLRALPGIDATAADAARDRYWREAEAIAPVGRDTLLIDKSPLFLMKLPLIRRLFPDARIILALRHPCDVLLSCLMSNFQLNTAMANFLRLEDAADLYDLSFRHWQAASALFPLRTHTIVYEELVAEPAAQLRPLFDFLDLDWHDDALDHVATARARGLVRTASYAQVAEPLYSRSAGRWMRYRRHLEPVFRVIAPWAETFGYRL